MQDNTIRTSATNHIPTAGTVIAREYDEILFVLPNNQLGILPAKPFDDKGTQVGDLIELPDNWNDLVIPLEHRGIVTAVDDETIHYRLVGGAQGTASTVDFEKAFGVRPKPFDILEWDGNE